MDKPLRILILEDRSIDAALLLDELRQQGIDPEWVRVDTEEEFLAQLSPEWDLILADYSMPKFDGMRALKLLKESGLDIPFIVVSGKISEEVAVNCMKEGAADYLLKDRLARLGPAVSNALEENKLQREKKKTDEELRRLKEFNESIVQSVIEAILIEDDQGNITFINPAAQELLGYTPEELTGQHWTTIVPAKETKAISGQLDKRRKGVAGQYEAALLSKAGQEIPVIVNARPLFEGDQFTGVLTAFTDITERKQAEKDLADKARELETLHHIGVAIAVQKDLTELLQYIVEQTADLVDAQSCSVLLLDEETGELVFRAAVDKAAGKRVPPGKGIVFRAFNTNKPQIVNDLSADPDYYDHILVEAGAKEASLLAVRLQIEDQAIGVLTALNKKNGQFSQNDSDILTIVANHAAIAIEKTRLYEAALAARQNAEEQRQFSENIVQTAPTIVITLDEAANLITFNQYAETLTGYSSTEIIGQNWVEIFIPDEIKTELSNSFQAFTNGPDLSWSNENPILCKDGSTRQIAWQNALLKDPQDQFIAVLAIGLDITERVQAEARIQQQLQQLDTLHRIDMAITASMDLGIIYNQILLQVIAHLNASAAAILEYNKFSHSLTYAALQGTNSPLLQQKPLSLGVGLAGRVALEHQALSFSLHAEQEELTHVPLPNKAEFVSYYGLPLIAKGELKGVLEIFHNQPFDPEPGVTDFLNTLASQAAIAIDNYTLFNELKSSKLDLTLAFDASLESWTKTLALRSPETETPSERITELTLTLARTFGVSEEQLAHVRRGVLLHDIGKMAVPDHILTKPEPLPEAEWEIMRQHPTFAHNMLSPVDFLRPASEIPHCHHEKWDGSGYPQGLQGKQIPLAARIFAVIDVWDALISHRPYREAWPQEKALTYIREQSGKAFDPEVVDAFFQIIKAS